MTKCIQCPAADWALDCEARILDAQEFAASATAALAVLLAYGAGSRAEAHTGLSESPALRRAWLHGVFVARGWTDYDPHVLASAAALFLDEGGIAPGQMTLDV